MHANLIEAQKRLEAAKEAYGHAVRSIDRQYLKPVIALGQAKEIAAVNTIRKSFVDVADVATVEPGAAMEQPEAQKPAAKGGKKK